jgi:hypothetical protein
MKRGRGRPPGSRNLKTVLLQLANSFENQRTAALLAPPVPDETGAMVRPPLIAPISPREFLEAVYNSTDPSVDLRAKIAAAGLVLRADMAAKQPDPADDAKLIDGEGWTEEKAARLAYLQREREKRGQ